MLDSWRSCAAGQKSRDAPRQRSWRRLSVVTAPSPPGALAASEKFFDKVERRQREEGVEPLSEDEAMKLANEELHAMRRERREEER